MSDRVALSLKTLQNRLKEPTKIVTRLNSPNAVPIQNVKLDLRASSRLGRGREFNLI